MRLYGVRNLNDLGGRFYVHIRCHDCGRRNCYTAAELLTRFPLHKRIDASIDMLKGRLLCQCGSRSAVAWSMSEPMEFGPEEFDELIDFEESAGCR